MSDLRAAVREMADFMVDVVEADDPGKEFGRIFGGGMARPEMRNRISLHAETQAQFSEAAAAFLRTRPEDERQATVDAATKTVAHLIAPLASAADPRNDA